MIEVNRRLEYADRTAIQQADQTIKKDVVRALIELVTNVDDSYRRLEQLDTSKSMDGVIKIEIQRRHSNAVMRVVDFAEGMQPERMDKCVGTYAEETSGTREGFSVRGFFGRGLKEAILGLGKGAVYSISDGKFCKCSIETDTGGPRYKREKPIRTTKAIREQFGLASGNGTVIEITINRSGIPIPLIHKLRTRLERHYSLRDILSNSKRKVLLVELDQRGKPKKEYELQYRYPAAERVLSESHTVPGFTNATVDIDVHRAHEPLESPAGDKDAADGGFVIKSPRAVLDLSLFKYEHDPAAERFFGHVNSPYLDKLLIAGEPIVRADRTGIDWSHEFARALKRVVEGVLEPLVERERQRAKESQRAALNRELRERIASAVSELNKIAQLELGAGTTVDDEDNEPFIPEGGFGFVPPYAQVLVGRQGLLILRAIKNGDWKAGEIVQVASDNSMILIHSEQVILEQDAKHEGLLSAKVIVEGRQVGAEAILTATLAEASAQAYLKVIAKREPTESPTDTPKKRGVFDDIRFDEQAEPRQRVRLEDGAIVIAVRAPSISPYLGPGGAGMDTPQGQIMFAELVSDAVCRHLAREGVMKGQFPSVPGAEADARQREFIRLQNQHTSKIHMLFVDPQFRGHEVSRRTGRPLREVTLGRSVLPV